MKRNILLFAVIIIVSIILIYPVGNFFNEYILKEQGGAGFDVGPDQAMINLFVGGMITLPFLSPLFFGIWGRSKLRWFFAIILSLPIIFIFKWAGTYLYIPFISFISGAIIANVVNFFRNRA